MSGVRMRRTIAGTAGIAIMAVVSAGCAGAPAPSPSPQYALSGTVTGADGAPVAGALVTLYDRVTDVVQRVETDASGAYSAAAEPGVYDVLVTDADAIDRRTPGGDSGGNVLVGPVVVGGDGTTHDVELPVVAASAETDPDRVGGRVDVTLLSGGEPVAGSVRLVPVTAISREEDVAVVPDAATADVDAAGRASFDFATDQILAFDAEIRDVDGTVVETVPVEKPEGDLELRLDIGVSDVVNLTGTAGPLEASAEAVSPAPSVRRAMSPQRVAANGGYTPLRQVAVTARYDEVYAGDPRTWEFTGTALYRDQTMYFRNAAWTPETRDAPAGDGEASGDAMFIDQYAGDAPWVKLGTAPLYRWENWQVSVHAPGPIDYTFFDMTGDSYALSIGFKPLLTTHTVAFDSTSPSITRIVAELPY